MDDKYSYDDYYLSYSGARLPLNMVNRLTAEDIHNRNTFFGVNRDEDGRIVLIHKRVYGAIELSHSYSYDAAGRLAGAEIIGADEDGRRLEFGSDGSIISDEEFEPDG
ncbi:hypothetical protein E4634_10825 [Mangrovimicrobium sediminis]|uniref:RHS repeat protein n=1 Tax=Mangrovimicrobium sediminis TaxID=2562682 RepID=A0A4Z0M2J8_9GAMM|nr:DUF6156 family protein [Haliea sp. SAOS-164]TGD73515.1 hypothetical protein E4634_10825 [Haliea sp. SAOS-164]